MFTSFRFLSSSLVWYSPVEDLKNLLGDSLGCSFRTILRLLCHYADICVSDLLHLFIFYAATEYFYEFTMTYHVKEAFEVEVNYVLIFIHYLLCSPQSITPPFGDNRNLFSETDACIVRTIFDLKFVTQVGLLQSRCSKGVSCYHP